MLPLGSNCDGCCFPLKICKRIGSGGATKLILLRAHCPDVVLRLGTRFMLTSAFPGSGIQVRQRQKGVGGNLRQKVGRMAQAP